MRVLIACDRAHMAGRLSTQLQVLGHEVAGTAADGRAAVEAARGLRPDLAILGLRLPALDGVEAAQAMLTGRKLPIILYAHYITADVVRLAQQRGIIAFLSPHADVPALSATIAAAQARFRELRILFQEAEEDWSQALRARVVVETAKRALMGRLGLLETEAFRYLRRYSRSLAMPLPHIAARILEADELFFGRPALARSLRVMLLDLAQHGDVPSPALR